MSRFDDIYTKSKKNSKEETKPEAPNASGRFGEILNRTQSGGVSFSGIDENYINTFISDSNLFLSSAEEEYGKIGWGNASSVYESRKNTLNDLNARSSNVRAWLNYNKDKLDADTYKSLLDNLDNFYTGASSILSTFEEASKYYSQWETEADYRSYLEQAKNYEELLSYDLDAGAKEIAGLSRVRDQYQPIANLYGNYNIGTVVLIDQKPLKETFESYYGPGTYDYYIKTGELPEYGANYGLGGYDPSINDGAKSDEYGNLLDENGFTTNGKYISQGSLKNLKDNYADFYYKYGSYEDLLTTIAQKEQYYNQAKRTQEGAKLASVSGNADFDEYNDYVSTENDGLGSKLLSQYGMGYEDLIYEYINGAENGMRSDILHKAIAWNASDSLGATGKFTIYDYLTEDEIGIYNYYYAKEGKEAAEKYLDSIQETLNYRQATDMYDGMEGNVLLELVFGVAAGLDQFESGIKNLFNFKDDYIPPSATQIASGMVREDLADAGPNLPQWLGGASLGQVGYDAITTTANMVPSIVTSWAVGMINPVAGQVVGNTLMGASAAGNAYQEALNLGYDKGQARAYSTLVGASEAGLQYLLGGVSNLGGKLSGNVVTKIANGVDNAFARTAIKLGGNMLSEGIEEGLQEILTPWFKSLTLHTNEDVNWSEVAYSTLLGALTAGFMEGGSTISGEVKTYKTGKQLQAADISAERLAEIGTTFSADTVAYQLAGSVNENTGAYTMGRLFNEIGATLTEQNVTEITNALTAKGMDYETAKKNAKALAYVVEGGQLSEKQIAVIEANEVLAEVARTTLIDANTTWNQRSIGYNEMLKSLADEMTSPKASRTKQAQQSVENAPTADTVDVQTENGTERVSEVESVDTSPAKVKSIANIEKGQATIKLEDDTEVSVKDADLSPDDGVRIETIASIDGISVEDANFILNTLRTNTNASAQMDSLGAKEAYKYGFYGFSQEHMTTHGVFSNSLTETQRKSIYETGRNARQKQVEAKQATVSKATGKKSLQAGKVHFEGDRSSLTERQSASLTAIEKVAEALGVQIYVFESKLNESGKRVGANGWYDPKDGSIHIDLHAGANGEGTMLFTAAHELTHFIRQWSPAKFKTLADFLMKEYGKKGVNMDALVREQMAKAKRNGRTISYDTAYEEVVADSMEMMLSDGKVIEKLAKLKEQDKALWQKIKDFINELAAKIRAVYEGMAPDSVEGRHVAEMVDAIERLQDLFTEGLVEASENYQASEEILAESGIAVDSETDSGSLFSVRDVLDDADRNKVAKALAERFDVTVKEAMEWLTAETSLASLILNPKYSRFLDYEADPGEMAIKQNSDYPQGTVDFSNICKKRREFTQVMNRVLRNFPNHVFAATDLAKIRTIMGEEGMTLPCGICYVEDRRQLDTIVAQDFIDGLKLYREGSKTRPDGKAFNANQLKGLQLTDGDTYIPTIYELVSLEGRNSLKAKNPNMEAAWVKYNNARGMQSVRLLTNEAEYKRQILKYSKSTVQSKNDKGGLRIYSFSDAEMFHLIDIIQVITDSAAVGLSLQGYTKVNEYAKAVKDTGEKLNRSLIPKGDLGYHIKDGKVILDYDTVEGIDITSEDFFDNKDNPNVGNITIGVNDIQIRAAMVSDFVDQIIPFHTGQSEEVLGEKGIAAWKNYKDFQTEKDIATGKTSGHQVNIYTEVIQAAEKEGKPIQNKRQFVEKFLEVCKENGLQPRFSDFLNTDAQGNYIYTEGYHKFLVDFKTFAQTEVGEYLPQMPVKPIFDNAYITGLLKAYVKEQQVKDVEVAKQMPKVIERITNEIIKSDNAGPGVLYSTREYAAQVDEVKNNTHDPNNHVYMGTTPMGVAKVLDLPKLPMLVTPHHIYSMAVSKAQAQREGRFRSRFNYHKLGWDTVKKLPEYINKPVLIIKSNTDTNDATFVVVTAETDKAGSPIIVAVKPNGRGFYLNIEFPTNFMLSGYGKDGIRGYVATAKTENRILYANKKYSQKNKNTPSVQFADTILSSDYTANLAEFKKIVKSKFVGTTFENSGLPKFSDRDDVPTFYSQMAKVIEGVKQEKLGAASVINMLRGKGVKAEEIKWSGIETWLEGKKSVTKAELQEFIAGSMLQIGEQISGSAVFVDEDGNTYTDTEFKDRAYAIADEQGIDRSRVKFLMEEDGYYAEGYTYIAYVGNPMNQILSAEGESVGGNLGRWSQYKLDGGENYRELVFTLPNSSYSNHMMRVHWGDDAEGVLAHARIQDMNTFLGKMLFVEEIQSDYHNEGHQSGYYNSETDAKIDELKSIAEEKFFALEDYSTEMTGMAGEWEVIEKTEKGAKLLREYRKAQDAYDGAMNEYVKRIPDAPFKDTYHEYVMKRLLRMAAEQDYDSIGWTTADIQSKRWSEEFAEGYRIEYDQDIPKFLNKYGRKWGTKVGKTVLDSGTEVWSMAITDSMKDSVLTEGQPLYQDRSDESVSNRSLLANALEGVAQNEIERNKIQEYKGKISLINSEEQKLHELNEQIKELSFSKGPRDTKKIRDLQIEAKQTANRISTYDKQLLRLEASKPLQDVLTREKKMAYQRAEQKGKEALSAYKEKAAKTQRELLDKWKESRKKGIESREKTAMRHKIQSVVGELNQLLLSNDKKRHVPENLKKAVADALALVNMDTVGAEERAAKYAALIAKETDPDKIDAYTVTMENILRQGEKMGQRLKELRDAYEEIQNSDDPDIANAYDPVIAGSLQELAQSIGNTSLRNMTIDQLQDVYDMYKMVLTRVRDANKSLIDSIKETIANRASRVVGEVKRVGGEHKYRVAILDFVKKFGWDNLKPVYAFEHIGSATLTDAFNQVRAGEDTWAMDVSEAREYYLDKSKKYGYDSWDFKKKYRFKSTSETEFELTLEQILSLYAYSKREQAHDHLRLGGFVFDSNIETYKDQDGKRSKGILKYKVNTADAHQISPEILASITGTLSKEQMAFVDEMQEYLSTVMGAKGNEITMKMYGVKLFKEKFYFPLKSAKQFMFEQNEVSGEVRIKNSGFTNKVVAKANNPVILSNFMDVWANHVNDMSMYHSFVLPLEDFNRIFNYNSPKQEGKPPVSVKGTIQNAYSPAAVGYVRQLITDLNGGARSDSTTGIINKMIGLFKKGSVFASLSVVVQQPSAIARAAALVDTKYFIGPKVDHKRHKALWDEVKQYAPVAIIKEMGYFDTNMGKSTQDFITGKEYSGFKEKMKALVVDSNYRDEVLSKAPALADEIAWCSIWEAVKRETAAKNPGMDVKSEAFLNKAGERFTEVITKTQVYDSVLSRSGLMRSKDTGMKMATAFMAEPTTSINMVTDALLQGKRGNKKYARTAIGAVIASQILNSILVSFVYAGRDDDEDETYLEKYIGTLSGEILDSLNPAGYIPFIKDIMSIVQGYDVERSDMAVVSDLWNAIQNLSKDNVSGYRKVEGFAGSIAQIFGLPVKNIMRDARGIYQTIDSFVNGQQTTKAGIGYAVKGAITGKTVSNEQQLYEAILSGDQAQIARVKSRFEDASAVSSAIRKALRENDPRIHEAAVAWNANDLDEYMRIAKQIIAEKHFSQDDVVMAIRAEANALKPDTGTTSTSKAKGLFTAEKFAEAIAQGDEATANAIKIDIIQTAQKNGKTEEEAEENFVSTVKSELKELFLSGKISEDKVVDALVAYCDMDESEAELKVESYVWEAQGYEGATSAAVRDYNTFCAASNVPKDVYLYIRSFSNNTENDKDANGKSIAYSAMKKVMAEINAQAGLTSAQKTAIARSLGWAEKNIQKYKTW